MTEVRYITTADTAKLIRAALKLAFPKQKFSVRSSNYSGGSSIDVNWDNGPTKAQVETTIRLYDGSSFDGMTDSTSYHDRILKADGTVGIVGEAEGEIVHFSVSFVFANRRLTPEFMGSLKAKFASMTQEERSALVRESHAYRHANPMPQSWGYDATLSDFGDQAEAVFRGIANHVAMEA